MTANRLLLALVPIALMIGALIGLSGFEHAAASLGKTDAQRMMFGRAGLALPFLAAAATGVIFLFAAAGAANIRTAGWGVIAGCAMAIFIAVLRAPSRSPALTQVDPAYPIGASAALIVGCFALRVAVKGNAAFAASAPKRVHGKRALHGDADWMTMAEAGKLLPDTGGIVVGERYRVDRDSAAAAAFRATDRQSWGAGGRSPLLCFDASFGSSHGIVFAGSGGYKGSEQEQCEIVR